jgi:hypothetical protein
MHDVATGYVLGLFGPRNPTRSVKALSKWKLLSLNVLPYFQIVTLTPEMYRETIQECADRGWIGDESTMLSTSVVRRKQLAIESILSTSAISNSWRRIWPNASVPLSVF